MIGFVGAMCGVRFAGSPGLLSRLFVFPETFFAKRATTIRAPIFAGVFVIRSSFCDAVFIPFNNYKPYRIDGGL